MPDRPSRFRRFRAPAFWLSLALLLGVGVASVLGVRGLRSSNEAIEHSYQTIRLIDSVERDLRMTEANARAYRLTGDEEHRERYLLSVPETQAAAGTLVDALARHPQQGPRAERLQALVEQRIAEMHVLFELQERDGVEAAQHAMNPGALIERWNQIDAVERALRDEEMALLRTR